MPEINTSSFTAEVQAWLKDSRQPRILHIFDSACNLINERKDVLSIVTPQIGNGPFNLVLERDITFSEHISLQSLISNSLTHLTIGSIAVRIPNSTPWPPRPNWETLHAQKDRIATQLPITNYQLPAPIAQFSNSLTSSMLAIDLPCALAAARNLSGLGPGLTPSGDDFIMGVIYAAWIIHPSHVAKPLTETIANAAAPLTTSLSAAWLRSAGRGEAGILWHNFFNALLIGNASAVQLQIEKLLSVGETSGADALAGFVALFQNILLDKIEQVS